MGFFIVAILTWSAHDTNLTSTPSEFHVEIKKKNANTFQKPNLDTFNFFILTLTHTWKPSAKFGSNLQPFRTLPSYFTPANHLLGRNDLSLHLISQIVYRI